MATTTPACYLHAYAPAANTSRRQSQPSHFTCKALKESYDATTTSHVDVSRRFALSSLVGAALVASKVSPADAVYGESANVFGKQKKTDFVEIKGDGFKIMIPAKWSPSKEREFSGQVIRYEDNFDIISNISVIVSPSAKSSITDYGTPEDFLRQFDYLLGKQTFYGRTDSEGGFDSSAVATANILETSTTEVDGKKYYSISVLTRTADGDEGGKHQLITAAVSNGKVYICKAQAGDKRWFKGARRSVENATSSFNVV